MMMPAASDDRISVERSRSTAFSYQSNSLPSTPRQRARELQFGSRTPSPSKRRSNESPRSASSESTKMKNLHRAEAVTTACRFKTTQTSRRRMAYYSEEILVPPPQSPKLQPSPQERMLLEEDIRHLYAKLLPSEAGQTRRELILKKLRTILGEGLPGKSFEIHVFGSSGNLLFTDDSDGTRMDLKNITPVLTQTVDICVTMRGLETTCVLAELLAKHGMKNVRCVHAKAVPIVKMWDPELDLNCDLNLNNHVALKNTHMVKTFIMLDSRVRSLAMIIKHWTKRRIINEASGGTLSSYTWTLLLINFLQTREPPILPRLTLVDDDGNQRSDFQEELNTYKEFSARNQESLADLFFNFFRRYGYEVDFENVVVSVREGRLLSKTMKGWKRANNNRLCVEEPFNTDRNLANTADAFAWRGLHLELRRAFDLIAEAKDIAYKVCEQYEFPQNTKPAIERPPPLPKPTLTRSLSQSSRGGRGTQSVRGNRPHQGRDLNRGPGSGNRRASSAAAFGHTAFPFMYATPPLALPGDLIFQRAIQPQHAHHQAGVGVHDQLAQLSRQLSAQEQQLRQRLNQSSVTGQTRNGLTSALPQNQTRPTPLQGFQLVERGKLDDAPSTAPLPHLGYPYAQWNGAQLTNGWTSAAPTQRGTDTSPSSPLLTPVSARRGLHRSTIDTSPGGAIRSQSQPARSMGPHSVSFGHLAPSYTTLLSPVTPDVHQQQQINHQIPSHRIVGQIQTPQGLFYVVDPYASESSVPLEYLGYGFREAPYFAHPTSLAGQPVPQYEDLRRQAWQSSPSYQRRSNKPSSTADPSRTSSPMRTSGSWRDGIHSAPLLQDQWHSSSGSHNFLRNTDTESPTVADGSSHAVNHVGNDLQTDDRPRRVSDFVGRGQPGVNPWQINGSHMPLEELHRSVVRESVDSSQSETSHSRGLRDVDRQSEVESVAEATGSEISRPSTRGSSRSSVRQPSRERSPHCDSGQGTSCDHSAVDDNPRLAPAIEPRTCIAQQGIPTIGYSQRSIAIVPSLDLSSSMPARFQDGASLAANKALSPVQEGKPPSPISARLAADPRDEASVKGTNGTRGSPNTRSIPQLPDSLRLASGEVHNGRRESPTASASVGLNTNPWQQAVKKGTKRSKGTSFQNDGGKGRSRGETMPADASQRKGG